MNAFETQLTKEQLIVLAACPIFNERYNSTDFELFIYYYQIVMKEYEYTHMIYIAYTDIYNKLINKY